jgi:transposase
MKDTELFAALCGVRQPWTVKSVRFEGEKERLVIELDRAADAPSHCPECGRTCPRYDKRVRQWRHLDTMQYQTIIEANVPRVNCPEHGVQNEQVPWSTPNSRLTLLFEAWVIRWLQETSIQAVARQLHLSWNTVDRIMHRAVERGLQRRPTTCVTDLCVDETSFQKRHEYVTIVSDRITGATIYVADGRSEEALAELYRSLTPEQLDAINTVTMDMWAPYINATAAHAPHGDECICFDRYHVQSAIGKAVNDVRKDELRQQLRDFGESALTGTRMTWLRNKEHLGNEDTLWFHALRQQAENTAEAWKFKEMARNLWSYKVAGWAENGWRRWIDDVRQTTLAPMLKVANMIEKHLWGIVNAVTTKSTNAMAESINSKVKLLKARARGFRSRDRFRTIILF